VAAVVVVALFGWRTVRVARPFVPPTLFSAGHGIPDAARGYTITVIMV